MVASLAYKSSDGSVYSPIETKDVVTEYSNANGFLRLLHLDRMARSNQSSPASVHKTPYNTTSNTQIIPSKLEISDESLKANVGEKEKDVVTRIYEDANRYVYYSGTFQNTDCNPGLWEC